MNYRSRIFLSIFALVLLTSGILVFYQAEQTRLLIAGKEQGILLASARSASLLIDPTLVQEVLESKDSSSSSYNALLDELTRIRRSHIEGGVPIKSIFLIRKDPIDPDLFLIFIEGNPNSKDRSAIEGKKFEENLLAQAPSNMESKVTHHPHNSPWGDVFIAYSPILLEDKVIALVGIALEAKYVTDLSYQKEKVLFAIAATVLGSAFIIAFILTHFLMQPLPIISSILEGKKTPPLPEEFAQIAKDIQRSKESLKTRLYNTLFFRAFFQSLLPLYKPHFSETKFFVLIQVLFPQNISLKETIAPEELLKKLQALWDQLLDLILPLEPIFQKSSIDQMIILVDKEFSQERTSQVLNRVMEVKSLFEEEMKSFGLEGQVKIIIDFLPISITRLDNQFFINRVELDEHCEKLKQSQNKEEHSLMISESFVKNLPEEIQTQIVDEKSKIDINNSIFYYPQYNKDDMI